MYWVYLIECSDSTLYTGWTSNLEKRIAVHNSGRGAKYTRGRTPVVLKYAEEYSDKNAAMQREWQVKQMSRSEKIKLIEKAQLLNKVFFRA